MVSSEWQRRILGMKKGPQSVKGGSGKDVTERVKGEEGWGGIFQWARIAETEPRVSRTLVDDGENSRARGGSFGGLFVDRDRQ